MSTLLVRRGLSPGPGRFEGAAPHQASWLTPLFQQTCAGSPIGRRGALVYRALRVPAPSRGRSQLNRQAAGMCGTRCIETK